MRKSIQKPPPSRRSPSLPWVVLSADMNLKNFPKRLDSKISPLRITVPENLDLALEGLIRKVLREQPKVDDIYTFAADYFDKLLKIRDKVGPKPTPDQLCPFHNDEDAHEMIKLANNFAKPGIFKTKPPEAEKTTNVDAKAKRKEFSKSTGKFNRTIQNTKTPAAVKKKPEQKPKKRKDQKSNETKPERPKTLNLEPKTEDVGEDEEFLKSDPIKVLVEKELMSANKSGQKDKKKDDEKKGKMQHEDKTEETATNEELCTVVDKDSIPSEEEKTEATVTKTRDEETKMPDVGTDKKEDVKDKKKENEMGKTETGSQNVEKDEAQTEAQNYTEGTRVDKGEKDLQDIAKDEGEKTREEIQDKEVENKPDDSHVEVLGGLSPGKEIEKSLENERKEDTIDGEINQKTSKEVTEGKDKFMELESIQNDDKEVQITTETAEALKDKITEAPPTVEEANFNPDELCTVVDVLSIKSLEKENAEKVENSKEKEPVKEEGINEVKIKAEDLPNKQEKEVAEIQKSEKPVETVTEHSVASNEDKNTPVISPTEKETQQENLTKVQVKDIEKPPDRESPLEKLKSETESEETKTNIETGMKEKEMKTIDPKDIKPESKEDQITTEDNLKGADNEASETTEQTEKPTAAQDELQDVVTTEEQLKPEEESDDKEHVNVPGTEAETKPKDEDVKLEKSAAVEVGNLTENETEAVETIRDNRKTEDESKLKPEEVKSVKAEKDLDEEPFNIKEELKNVAEVTNQPKPEMELQNEEMKSTEETESVKEVENKMKDTEKEKQREEVSAAEVVSKANIDEDADYPTPLKDSEKKEPVIVHESVKPVDEPKEQVATMESTDLPEANKRPEQVTEEPELIRGDELSQVSDAEHIIKVEEAEEPPNETAQPEGVQIKTIQTHYYDTLQVPEQITKEYRVHAVKNDEGLNNLVGATNSDVPPEVEQTTTSATVQDLPKQELDKTDLEDSLMSLSSNNSLNVSELSIQTISEMFLDSEKKYSSIDREERRFVTKPGDECGDEGRGGKQEVEEIIHKTVDPFTIGATPVAPRDDSRISEEANMEGSLENEKKENPSVESNEGRSIDSDTAVISLEVKTVIETQVVDDEKDGDGGERSGREESDVQIRIETTIDVPEGVIVNVREEKDEKDEVRQRANDEPTTSGTVPGGSQTSSGESDSTISSTATEIKRTDTAKRHFSSTRTLITTQSLDRDKRNPLLKTRSLSFRQGVTDFEVWNAIEKELEEAATKIQSNFRGYKTRKKLQRENAVQITTEESSCSTSPVERDEGRMQTTGEFHDSIILSEHPR